MNLQAIKTVALVLCNDTEHTKKDLRGGGYVSITGRGGLLAILNISKKTLERMCRNKNITIVAYMPSDKTNIGDVLRSA